MNNISKNIVFISLNNQQHLYTANYKKKYIATTMAYFSMPYATT